VTSTGCVLTLCRQFQNAFRISTPLSAQQSALTLTKSHSHCHVGLVRQCRRLHTTTSRGLEEFFDIPENWGEATVKSGAPWIAKQLRTKSNEDVHKLWYVLLKEKNMLLTTEQESKRQRIQMPSPERLKKVDDTALLTRDTVVKEREDALRLLQTGQERARPGAWRKDVFGRVYWYGASIHNTPPSYNISFHNKVLLSPYSPRLPFNFQTCCTKCSMLAWPTLSEVNHLWKTIGGKE
uniref:Large ribosomal subunit protein uL29m n=1 Tax=Oncorhynchus tshawytscha TaxID=74940 RepID=A0A8C8CQP6_ONCTS